MAKIFLAGSENTTHLQALLENGATNVLFSYFYIAKRGQMYQLFSLLERYPHVKVFLDSGAFSFRVGTTRFTTGHQQSPAAYFDGYLRFVREHGHRFEFAAEFDVDEYDDSCSEEQLEEWRSQLCELGTTNIVPVWHPNRGYPEWERYCTDNRYTHLGFGTGGLPIEHGIQSRLINRAHYHKKTVHGFAQTKILTTLKYVKFDTIDSTSWKMGERYGQTFIFWRNRWEVLAKHEKEQRRMFKRYFKAIGCDWRLILKDDIEEVRKANIIAWENLSKRLQVIHRSHVGLSTLIKSRDGEINYQVGDGYRARALNNPHEDVPTVLVLSGAIDENQTAEGSESGTSASEEETGKSRRTAGEPIISRYEGFSKVHSGIGE